MEEYVQLLRKIGLSESEAKIFLAGVKLGPASVIQLSQKVGLTRQMVYSLLPGLVEKGLVKEVRIGRSRHFQSIDVALLRDYAERITTEIKKAIPILKTEQATSRALPTLQVFENPISIREWYRRFMKEATAEDELLLWVTNTAWMSSDPDYLKDFIAFKNKLKIHDRIIAPDTEESREYAKQIGQPYAEYRFMQKHWKTNAEKWIWRDTISYLTISENATNLIVIESAPLAAIERASFNLAWRSLKGL